MAERYQRTLETDQRLKIASRMLQAERSTAGVPVEIQDGGGEVEHDARLLACLNKHRQATADVFMASEEDAIPNPIFVAAATPEPLKTSPKIRSGLWFGRGN